MIRKGVLGPILTNVGRPSSLIFVGIFPPQDFAPKTLPTSESGCFLVTVSPAP